MFDDHRVESASGVSSPSATGHQPTGEGLSRTLIVGIGNTLRGDDALGRIAAGRLRQLIDDNDVRILDRCLPTPELAAEFSEVARVIFLDASVDGPADQVVTRRVEATNTPEATGHRLDVGTLLCWSEQLYGHAPQAYAITFRGRSFDFNDCCLTSEAESALEQIVQQTLRLLGSASRSALERDCGDHGSRKKS